MESRTTFCTYHAGEVPPVKHFETEEEAAVLGFTNSVAVVVPTPKPPQPKKLMLQTDTASGKKFFVVNGKRVEVKEVVKVKQKPTTTGVAKAPSTAMKMVVVAPKQMNSVETSTDGLLLMKSVSVQTDAGDFERAQPIKGENAADLVEYEGLIIREDVRMGQGPRCPTPRVNHFREQEAVLPMKAASSPNKVAATATPVVKATTRTEQLLQLVKKDYAECVNFDVTGNMPIHAAVVENNVHMVMRQCVALKYKGVSVNTTNYSNLTPLQLAVLYEVDPSIFEILLQYGADPSVVDADGNNVFHLAVMQSRENILDTLLKSVDIFPLGAFNYDGLTPLMVCCCTGKVKMAAMLLKKQIDPNMRDQKSGRTALFHAVEANDEKMVNLLLINKADAKVKNFVGMSAHDAVFEIDDLDNNIVLMVLGRDHAVQNKSKNVKRKTPAEKVIVGAKKPQVKITVERRYQKCYINNKVRVLENGGT